MALVAAAAALVVSMGEIINLSAKFGDPTRSMHAIMTGIGFLGAGLIFSGKHDGPALFIRGEKSNYYAPGDEDRIKAIFPNAEVVTMNTGHWVQAEKPEEFARIVLSYLTR